MSFFDFEDDVTTEFDMGGNDFELIPQNTNLLAAIEEASWKEWEGDRYINLRWKVIQPEEYSGRIVFQKIKVFGDKAEKAKRMLAAIDANAGGKLMKLGTEPDDMDLMGALLGKPMMIKVMVWKIKEEGKSGNWVAAVSPAKGSAAKAAPAKKATKASDVPVKKAAEVSVKKAAEVPDDAPLDIDDEIPF